jgi:hypothetical protein
MEDKEQPERTPNTTGVSNCSVELACPTLAASRLFLRAMAGLNSHRAPYAITSLYDTVTRMGRPIGAISHECFVRSRQESWNSRVDSCARETRRCCYGAPHLTGCGAADSMKLAIVIRRIAGMAAAKRASKW